MEMETNQITHIEKLGILGIFKESLKIPYNYPKFILLTFFTSLPLIFAMVVQEIIPHPTIIRKKAVSFTHSSSPKPPFLIAIMVFPYISPKVFDMGILYLFPLQLINTIITIHLASAFYTNPYQVNMKQIFLKLFEEKRLKGPMITSGYVLFINGLVRAVLKWAFMNFISLSFADVYGIVYGIFWMVLLVKWMEWGIIWNMGIMFSILEEKHGLQALQVSGYFSRGDKRRGLCLVLVSVAGEIGFRLLCIYVDGNKKWSTFVGISVLSCAGNVMRWVVWMVYFHDCKKRVLEKKVHAEEE